MPEAVVIPGEPENPKMNLPFPQEYEALAGRTVEASEIDYNGHMNNSHYLDWTEALPEESWLNRHALKRVWIEYTQEMTEGQGLYHGMYTQYTQGTTFPFLGTAT